MTRPDMEAFERIRDQNSMDYWWPRLRSTDVRTPRTVRLEIAEEREFQDGLALPVPDRAELHDAIETVGGPPAFLRSDLTSRKHRMEASRIEEAEPTERVVAGVVEQHHLAMMMPMPSSWYVREWLDLFHHYSAWAYDHHDYHTPIAAEIRYFINEGEIHDAGFYWPEAAITRPDREDWRDLHQNLVKVTHDARHRLGPFLESVCEEFDTGYWSVDFALTENRDWYCIDMARGEFSWHPEGIEQIRTRRDLVEGGEP